tara:strand:+ start:670 stop:1845 length:1176 start_codon:yes stop_codon:yes gene_type:complete
MLLKELFLKEDNGDIAVFAFGRFNPPTVAHKKLIDLVKRLATNVNGRPFIFLSHTQNNKTDPLNFNEKLNYLESVYGKEEVVFGDPNVKTIVQVLQTLQDQGRTKVVMVAGDDRLANFKELLNKYNNKPDKSGKILYNFDTIKVTSAGQRDPDAEGMSGVSASKARQYAQDNDFDNFSKIVMGGQASKEIFQRIQSVMGQKVAVNNEKLYNEDMNDKPTVYLDMDGVLADFFGGVEKLYGVQHWKELTSDKTKDLKQEVINRITGTDFFATLPKFESADALIDMVKKFTGGKFSINTSPLRGDNENSAKYKKIWISNNIDTPDDIIVTGRKETYAKDKATGTPNILIDDRPVNIERFKNAGGYGILYQANRDPLSKVQKGLDDYAKIRRDQ